MKKLQNGFALIEGLLIALILAIIGFGGYYVWHTQKNTNKTSKDAINASQSTTSPTNSSQSQNGYLTIAQWGVRSPYDGSVHLEYKLFDNDKNAASFSSTELDKIDQSCNVNLSKVPGYAGVVTRYLNTDIWSDSTQSSVSMTAEQYAATVDKSEYGHVGDYYFFYTHPQGVCSEKQTAIDAQGEANQALKTVVADLVAIPQ